MMTRDLGRGGVGLLDDELVVSSGGYGIWQSYNTVHHHH